MNNTQSSFKLSYSGGLILTSVISFLIIISHVIWKYEPYTYGDYDPGWMILTTISIADDFDLDLKNQLQSDPGQLGGQVSLGVDDQWYPLHEWLISLLAVPFYWLLGINGTLLLNIILSFVTVIFMYKICCKFFSTSISFISSVLTLSTSLLLTYSYSFSVDVLGVFFATISLYLLLNRNYLFAGLVYSLAVLGRNMYGVVLPAFFIFIIMDRFEKSDLSKFSLRNLFKFCAGGIPGAIIFFLQNFLMFGSPFNLAYRSWIDFDEELNKIIYKEHDFSRSILEGLQNILLSNTQSVFIGIPLLVFGLMFGTNILYEKSKPLVCFIFLSFVGILFCQVTFADAYPGEYGNRYFIFLAPLSALLLGASFERFQKK